MFQNSKIQNSCFLIERRLKSLTQNIKDKSEYPMQIYILECTVVAKHVKQRVTNLVIKIVYCFVI